MGVSPDVDGPEGLSEADLAAIAARADAHSRRDILRLIAEVRRLEAALDRAVDRALEHHSNETQARHQLAQTTARAEAAEADARELREDVGAAIRVLPGGTSVRPLAAQVADLAAEYRDARAAAFAMREKMQSEVDEARDLAKLALSLLREMPVGLDELDERLSDENLPEWVGGEA